MSECWCRARGGKQIDGYGDKYLELSCFSFASGQDATKIFENQSGM